MLEHYFILIQKELEKMHRKILSFALNELVHTFLCAIIITNQQIYYSVQMLYVCSTHCVQSFVYFVKLLQHFFKIFAIFIKKRE